MNYKIHRPSFESAAKEIREALKRDKKLCRKRFGKPIKKVSKERLADEAFRLLAEAAQAKRAQYGGEVLDTAVTLEEWGWRQDGCHIYFPLPGFLEQMYKMKANVDLEELVFPHRLFTVAIPNGFEIEGLTLPPFMVGAFELSDKQQLAREFGKAIYGQPMQLDPGFNTKQALFITFHSPGFGHVEGYYVRCSVPFERLRALLDNDGRDDEELINEVLGTYEGVAALTELTREERLMQYRIIRCVVMMALYIKLFPNAVQDGYPPNCSNPTGVVRNPNPKTIGGEHFRGTHASPAMHWRDAHFRRYPIRKDGTRKSGYVFVGGTIVNKATPHTVDTVDE
jgi:hypothetical protein